MTLMRDVMYHSTAHLEEIKRTNKGTDASMTALYRLLAIINDV